MVAAGIVRCWFLASLAHAQIRVTIHRDRDRAVATASTGWPKVGKLVGSVGSPVPGRFWESNWLKSIA